MPIIYVLTSIYCFVRKKSCFYIYWTLCWKSISKSWHKHSEIFFLFLHTLLLFELAYKMLDSIEVEFQFIVDKHIQYYFFFHYNSSVSSNHVCISQKFCWQQCSRHLQFCKHRCCYHHQVCHYPRYWEQCCQHQ